MSSNMCESIVVLCNCLWIILVHPVPIDEYQLTPFDYSLQAREDFQTSLKYPQ